MNFPRYPAYKDSGVDWLGAVPDHWSVEPFKRQIERNDGGVWGDEPDGESDTVVLRSTEQSADGRWQVHDPAVRKLSAAEINGSLLVEGDLLLTKSSGSSLHIGKTTLVTAEISALRCCYSNFMQRIRLRQSYLPKLAWHVMNNDLARRQFDLLSNSSTGLANLNASMVGQIEVPVPPLQEQVAIAEFLDRETAKIDALVAEQEQLIELLKEKRQAVISQAVTKGLDPSVPMKDSGVEWLGEVPAHWGVRQVRSIASFLTSGPRGWSERVGEEGSLFVQSGDLTDDLGIAFSQAKRVAVENDAEAARTRLLVGDVVVCITGAKTGNVAVCAGVEEDAYINQHLCLIRPTADVLPWFLGVFLKSDAGQRYFGIAQYGLKQGLSLENVKATPLLVPPVSEQEALVAAVTHASEQMDQLIGEAVLSIELLRERRTALISAAVTGQIDVRGWVTAETAA